jgi:PRTRC genetic system protein E
MFQQLAPLLRHRSVLFTVTHLGDDQIRVNLMPKKLEDSENAALATPMSFTGTADELDAQLPEAIVAFVSSHLELKNTLARAKEEMVAAAKAAQEEARSKSKNNKKSPTDLAKTADVVSKEEPKTDAEPPKMPSLFDIPADRAAGASVQGTPVPITPVTSSTDEEEEILAEISEKTSDSTDAGEDGDDA